MAETVTQEQKDKYNRLREILKELGQAAVAFSGGVDSTFLMKTAQETLGENAVAVTVLSESFPESERREAEEFCRREGIRQITVSVRQMDIPGFRQNPPDRCYLCKKAIFTAIREAAGREGISWVAEGSNMDDLSDFRPGQRAIRELGVHSPLQQAGLSKADIRALSARMGLKTASKPSLACLATRFAYGEEITEEKLRRVEAAEEFLKSRGFFQLRVRSHGNLARIEILPGEFGKLLENRQEIVNQFKTFGFSYVTMDIQGYRTGSMNEMLSDEARRQAEEGEPAL